MSVYALALTQAERAAVARAVEDLVEREGLSDDLLNILEMLRRPLQERELLGLREGAEA